TFLFAAILVHIQVASPGLPILRDSMNYGDRMLNTLNVQIFLPTLSLTLPRLRATSSRPQPSIEQRLQYLEPVVRHQRPTDTLSCSQGRNKCSVRRLLQECGVVRYQFPDRGWIDQAVGLSCQVGSRAGPWPGSWLGDQV